MRIARNNMCFLYDENRKTYKKSTTVKALRRIPTAKGFVVSSPLAPENCNLNNFVLVFLLTLSGVFRISKNMDCQDFCSHYVVSDYNYDNK